MIYDDGAELDVEDFVPASEVIGNLTLFPLPENQIPVEAVVLVKTIGPEGGGSWYTRYTYDLHAIEALGAVNAARLLIERDVLNAYLPHMEDEE